VVETVPEAVALMPPARRPAEADYWKYKLELRVQSHAVPTLLGVDTRAPNRLVFDVDFWEKEADRTAGRPPARRNTWFYGFNYNLSEVSAVVASIREQIADFVIRAQLGNYLVDYRHPQASALATKDPVVDTLGLCTHAVIVSGLSTPIDTPAHWRTP
jgi:hypothetical protein